MDLMKLVFHNTPKCDVGGLGDNLYISLHTADPCRTGLQSTSEATFGGYGRVGISRTSSRWQIVLVDSEIGPVKVTNAVLVSFPEATVGKNEITYIAAGTSATGPGKILYPTKLIQPLSISPGIIAEFKIGDLSWTES